ncbi:MAG: hypothetical protein GTO18_14970, partial [Anaerolineales bacterium]|nr:hypothetical protein [Anaerolineales bacterium]
MKHKDIIVTAMALVALLISMSTIRGPESAAADSLPSAAAAPLFSPMGTGFSYQGQLRDSGGSSITDTCDFRFTLWDSVSDGTQIGSESTAIGVGVVDGYFNALVNDGGEFGAGAFNGEGRWLEIDVKCTGDPDWTALSPRQSLTPTPYAIYAASIGPHDHWGEV